MSPNTPGCNSVSEQTRVYYQIMYYRYLETICIKEEARHVEDDAHGRYENELCIDEQ